MKVLVFILIGLVVILMAPFLAALGGIIFVIIQGLFLLAISGYIIWLLAIAAGAAYREWQRSQRKP